MPDAIGRVGARWAGRAFLGYLLLAAVAATDPDVLSEPAAGNVSVGLILLILQVPLLIWVLVGHEREMTQPISSVTRPRRTPHARNRREAP
ncbi:hypothetical protein ACFQ63_04520 [Streptomyces wedmorensis]|uniref:Uncharacterized protein n=1 Tax=Streptomyces wedmorensis TaxID=43759 RepID=A0ABW6IMY9_STRWE